MRAALLLPVLCACASGPHAEAFVKRDFGFAGPRELSIAGPSNDTHLLGQQLRKRGFTVLEVAELGAATTRYAADIAGVCDFAIITAPDTELHVFVVKVESHERVLSVRLGSKSECPDAFFAEAAAAIARHWPVDQVAAQ